MRKLLAVYGASGHALVVASAIHARAEYEIVGFLDDLNPERHGESFGCSKILGEKECVQSLRNNGVLHIALGFGNCSARLAVGNSLLAQGFELPAIVHPRAILAEGTSVGEGTFIGAGAILDPECVIGRFVIINNGAIVCHNSRVDDGAHICPGVSMGGWVHVGRCSWVGIGSCVKDRISIGVGSFVGAGSVVAKDIPAGVVAYGSPASQKRLVTTAF